MTPPHFLTNRRICRKVWEQDSEKQQRHAIEHMVEASFYVLSNQRPPKEFWNSLSTYRKNSNE